MGEAVCEVVGVNVIEGVIVTLGVQEGVTEGVMEGVSEEVRVTEGVNVAGTNGVKDTVLVGVKVVVGVKVKVGVFVTVLVKIDGVGLRVGEGGVVVKVKVGVAEGVRSAGPGASMIASQPIQ